METAEQRTARKRQWRHASPEVVCAARKRYRKAHPDRVRAYRNLWDRKNPIKKMFLAARQRSRKMARPFDDGILQELEKMGIPERCPVYGISIFYSGSRTDNSPSIDCVVQSLGYAKGNVRIISWLANRHKDNASAEQHEAIAKYIREHLKADR